MAKALSQCPRMTTWDEGHDHWATKTNALLVCLVNVSINYVRGQALIIHRKIRTMPYWFDCFCEGKAIKGELEEMGSD